MDVNYVVLLDYLLTLTTKGPNTLTAEPSKSPAQIVELPEIPETPKRQVLGSSHQQANQNQLAPRPLFWNQKGSTQQKKELPFWWDPMGPF